MSQLIFFILGCISTYLYFNSKGLLKSKVYKRRGIYEHQLSTTGDFIEKSVSFLVTMEVEEIESTNNKSKIRILSVKASQSQFNTDSYINTIKKMIDNTWVKTDSIEWITGKAEERTNKINEILN